ncbi:hypothetical protein ANANG_G00208750 [Anguilla anguilla]|uniref:Chemokine interleukin-8-like domain-containing protein n=1 Tax=Anguilla anguilla TaxID=7936 RepID=A0A9D3LZF3_ANGAN|nr:hypothetical protein ANANG_G00208750 [Anguilla anguilla]
MLKISICLALLLYGIMPHHADGHPMAVAVATDGPESCCFKFFKGRIPSANIVTITKIYSDCPHQGFIVKTVKEKSFCVDAEYFN